MKTEPHILFVSSWYPTPKTSQGTFVQMHLLALQSRGCRCTLFLTSEATFGNYLRAGANREKLLDYQKRPDVNVVESLVIHLWPLRWSRDPIERRRRNILTSAKNKMEDYIEEEGRPDFIFHHGIFDFCYLTEFLSREFKLPVRYLENSPKIELGDLPVANPFDTDASRIQFVKNADRRYAATHAYVAKMEEVFGVDFELCPNVVTDDFFVDEPAERSMDYFQFVNVAILDERKNQRLLIETFANRFRDRDNFRLVVAGDGPLRPALLALTEELGVSEQVDVRGFINRDEVIALLDESHVFVLASRAETFGVVVVEAMARGIPVVSSNIDGTREIITQENGLLFPPGDKEAMGDAMEWMVGHYDEYTPHHIVESVRSRFGPDAVVKALFGDD